jgi:type III restriction enzyme
MDLMRRIRLASGQAVLFEKLYEYIPEKLFTTTVSLEDTNVLRNLSEYDARTALYTTFSKAINEISVSDAGSAQVVDRIKLSKTRPTIVNNQPFVMSKKSLFTKTVGDSALELRFANFLDQATDVKAFAKNGRNTHFFVEYVNSHGELSRYYPDFLVRSSTGVITIVETKGLEDLDVKPKWDRLVLWCKDATDLEEGAQIYHPLFVSQTELDEFSEAGKNFAQLWRSFSSHGPIGAGS